MKKIQTFFFDIGNVLIYFDLEKMYRQIGDLCKCPHEHIKTQLEVENRHILYEKGGISTQELHDFLCTMSSVSFSLHDLRYAMSDIFLPNESIYPLVHELKTQGIQLGLLSNTCEAHFDFIQNSFSIFEIFEIPILSYKIGARKPEVAIYRAALEAAKCSPEACFYIDDIPEYVNTARSLGISSEIYESTTTLLDQLKKREILT